MVDGALVMDMTHPIGFAIWIWFLTVYVAGATGVGVYRSLKVHSSPKACLMIDIIGVPIYAAVVALAAYAGATGH
jgi:hypothetical protein